MQTFTETQRFRQWWLWLIIIASGLITAGVLLIDGCQPFDLVPLSIPLLLAVLLYIARLDTRVDQIGIRYRFFPLTGWRSIPWSRVEKAEFIRINLWGTAFAGRSTPGITTSTVSGDCTSTASMENDWCLVRSSPTNFGSFCVAFAPKIRSKVTP